MSAHRSGKGCDCAPCGQRRARGLREQWLEYGGAALPDPEKTVFIRAYFRKQKNHMRKQPHTLEMVTRILRQMVREARQASAKS